MKGTVRIYGAAAKFQQGGTSHRIPGVRIPLFRQRTSFALAFPFSSLSSQVAELRRDQTTREDEDVTSVSLITGVTFPPGAFPLSENAGKTKGHHPAGLSQHHIHLLNPQPGFS